MYRRFALTPLGKSTQVFLLVLGALMPVVVAVLLVLVARQGELEPAMALVLQAVVATAVLAAALPAWRREAAFDGERIRVKAHFFTRESRLTDFDLDGARVVDIREHTELRPWLKTLGLRVPGLHAGHFRLRDGRRAFCLVSDPARVLALPHADGRVWLLGLEHPQAVLDILRRARA